METRRSRPSVEEIRAEIERIKYRKSYASALRGTIYALLVVAAVAVLLATLAFPVLQIYGHSMTPTLNNEEIVVAAKQGDFKRGDVVAFYYNNKILIKRVIASAGQWVNIDQAGNVAVDGETLQEPYVTDKSLGECDIELPYQVPDGKWFLMGDHRTTSVDSRTAAVGCISEEEIIGKVALRVWPLNRAGWVR